MREAIRGDDPTRMRNQPVLWTSQGRSWLIVGGVTLALCGGMLLWLMPLGFLASLLGLVGVVVVYAGMWVLRVDVHVKHRRLVAMAWLYLLMLAIAFAAIVWIGFHQ